MLRLPADNGHVPLVQRKSDRASDFLLRAFDKCVERFPQWREPQAVINQLSVLQPNMLFEMHNVAFAAEGFEFTMCGNQQCSAWCLVTSSRLDTNETVLDNVNPADRVASADFIQQFDQRHRTHTHSVHS